MSDTSTISEADILSEIVAPDEAGLAPEAAQSILDLRFTEVAQRRIRRLLDKNNRGTLTETERGVLEKYLRVGQFLDLLQAKARLSLQREGDSQ